MNRFISKVLKKTANFLNSISNSIYKEKVREIEPSIQSIRVKPWFDDNGDKTLRLNYELNEKSIAMDLGGYEGQWSADIFCKYNCTIHVFEPVDKFARNIKERFKKNLRVSIYTYGLTKANAVEKINISADRSSAFQPADESVEVQFVKIDDFLDEHRIENIDLIKINIEGGEYELLEHLVQSDLILIFDNIQVQFHDFVPDAINRMHNIQSKLTKTHSLTYQYEFVWENWKRKTS